jgi:hypothetical protein
VGHADPAGPALPGVILGEGSEKGREKRGSSLWIAVYIIIFSWKHRRVNSPGRYAIWTGSTRRDSTRAIVGTVPYSEGATRPY